MPRGQPRARAVAVALACAAASLACRGRPREQLTIGYQRQPAMGLLLLAAQQGFFRDEALDVKLREFTSGREAFLEMIEGRLDAATVYTTPVLLQAFQDPPPRILTMLHQSRRNTALLARADRGIRTAADLRGKTIGVPHATNAEFFLRTLLEFAGVDWEEVHVLDMGAGDLPDALLAGRIDAAALWMPLYDRAARALGPSGAVTLRSDVYADISMLVTRPDVLASRRPALSAALRALSRAGRLAAADPEGLPRHVAAMLPGIDPAELQAQLQRVQLRLGVSHVLLQSLRSEAEWLARAGRMPRSFVDLRSLVVTDLLDEVEPELVTLESNP